MAYQAPTSMTPGIACSDWCVWVCVLCAVSFDLPMAKDVAKSMVLVITYYRRLEFASYLIAF